MSQLRSDEEFEINSDTEQSPRLAYISFYIKKINDPSSKGLSLQSIKPRQSSGTRKRKLSIKATRRKASKALVEDGPDEGLNMRVSATPSPQPRKQAVPTYLQQTVSDYQFESNVLPMAAPESLHQGSIFSTPPIEVSDQSQGSSQSQFHETKRYKLRERGSRAQKFFTNTDWIDRRSAVPKDANISFLHEPIEGYDISAHNSFSEDGEFLPDELESPKSQPLIPVNEYTTSESEPISPDAKRGKGENPVSFRKTNIRSPCTVRPRPSGQKENILDTTSFPAFPELSSYPQSDSPSPVIQRRRVNQIIVSDSDEPRQEPSRTKQSKKINFISYFQSHIEPAFSSRSAIPLFLRICHRRYKMRAQDPAARLVDYPWAKCIYSVDLKTNTVECLPFHMSKSLVPRSKSPNKPLKAIRESLPANPRVPRCHLANRRARLFTPRKKQDLLDFYHRLDMEDQRLYQRRLVDPDSFFYRFNEPGFSHNANSRWVPKEASWFQANLNTYKIHGWPLGTFHPRIQPAKGWGLFSLAVPTRTGQQCEEYYQSLVADNPQLALTSRPITQSYRKRSFRISRAVWADPVVRKYVRGIPVKRSRPKAARPTKMTDYFNQPETSILSSSPHAIGMDNIALPVGSPTMHASSNIMKLQEVTEMLVPRLLGGVYFDSKTFIGSGLLRGFIEFVHMSAAERGYHSLDSLPILTVADSVVDLKKEYVMIPEMIEDWGRWLLKKIDDMNFSSNSSIIDDVESIFEAYRLLLSYGGIIADLICDQLITVETFLPSIHRQLHAQLFGPIQDIIGIHTRIIDCLARYHILFPNPKLNLFSYMECFIGILVQYAISFTSDCLHLPLNHSVVEGLQVLREIISITPKQPNSSVFQGVDFWRVVNRSLLSNMGEDPENIWKGLSAILRSTAANVNGVFPHFPPKPTIIPPNWHIFIQVLSWATHTESTISPPDQLSTIGLTDLFTLPKPIDEAQYVHELLIRAAIVIHHWNWTLSQEVVLEFYHRLKDFCGPAAGPQFPGFLIRYSGTIPSLAEVISSPESHSSFEIYLLLVTKYIEQVTGAIAGNRQVLNEIVKFQSIITPTCRVSFETYSKERLCFLINLLSVRLIVVHALPFTVESLDKQIRIFIKRLRQLTGTWDKLTSTALSSVIEGFFIALHIAAVRSKELPENSHVSLISKEVLDVISDITKAAEDDSSLTIQFRNYMQELICNLLPLSGARLLMKDSLSLFDDNSRFFSTVNPYSTSYCIQAAAVEILDTFLGRLIWLLVPPPPWVFIDADFDIDFDDEELELLTQQPVITPSTQLGNRKPSFNEVAQFFYDKKTHLRLIAIISNHLNTTCTIDSGLKLSPFRALRSSMLVSRIYNTSQLPVMKEFWDTSSLTRPFQSASSSAHYPYRTLWVDEVWLMMTLHDANSWNLTCLRSAILLWAHVISDPTTYRHELLTRCLAWAARNTNFLASYTHFFCGEEWCKFALLDDKRALLLSEPEFFDNHSSTLMKSRQDLLIESVTGMKTQLDGNPLEGKEAYLLTCRDFLNNLLDGVRYNLDREEACSCLSPESSVMMCTIIDSVFKALPWLAQHGPIDDLTKTLLSLSAGGLLWKYLSYESLNLRVKEFQSLDYTVDTNLQNLLWSWYRNLVLQDLESPDPLLPGASLEKVADLFLPALTSHMAWNGRQSKLRGYLYSAVISPILLSPFNSWHLATLEFLQIMLSELLKEVISCLARPTLFKLVCSPIQLELDIPLYCLHHLALEAPQIWLATLGLGPYFSILSTLAQLATIIKRGNFEFFESNIAWFEKVQLILSTALASFHHFWLNLIKENGPLNMTIPRTNFNMLISHAAHNVEFSTIDLSWEFYCQEIQSLLDDSKERFTASFPPTFPSIIPNQHPIPIPGLAFERSIEQLIEVSTQILLTILPVWCSASHLSVSLNNIIWSFFAASSQHPSHLPHFFIILDRILDRLHLVGGSAAQLQDVFLSMGPRCATLMNWYKFSRRSLPPSLCPTQRGSTYGPQVQRASPLCSNPLL